MYGADGTKLRTTHTISGTVTTTDFCDDVIYENGTAKLLLTEEGYVSLSDSKYHYYLKDHQGNNRVVVDQSGNVEETNHYYPFGGIFASTENIQPYKYNGKEFDSKKGLNWYDYGARMYDPALGRFTTVDAMGEKYYSVNSYAYCGNNPMNYTDLHGDSLSLVREGLQEAITTIYNGLADKTNISMKFNNGILDPTSIQEQAKTTSDTFLQDLYEIATNPMMTELSISNKNTYMMNGRRVSEEFASTPYDDDDALLSNREDLQKAGIPVGKHIQGNLGQTLIPGNASTSGKSSTNNNIQIIINGKGSLNHRTVGLAHEFGHVLLYMRGKPYGHRQPGVDRFVYNRATIMSKRLGYDY